MDEIYRDVYTQLYDSFPVGRGDEDEVRRYNLQWSPFRPDAQLIRKIIDDAEGESFAGRKKLRPDAKLFLLINFSQMILLPVSLARRRQNVDLERILFADAVSLLKQAGEETSDGEVSSHTILNVVAKNWKKLNLSGLKLWED